MHTIFRPRPQDIGSRYLQIPIIFKAERDNLTQPGIENEIPPANTGNILPVGGSIGLDGPFGQGS
ncbi:MAG: hypothetical protein AB7U34_10585, partial [Novosphingobium sp.]